MEIFTMKRFLLLSVIFLLFIPFRSVYAASDADIKINGKYILFGEAPYIENSVMYAPVRRLCEALGAEVFWNESEKCAVIAASNTTLTVYPHKNNVYKNNKIFKSGKITLTNGRIFVPIRLIADALDMQITWDSYYKNACIESPKSVSGEFENHSLTDDEIFWLGRIIEAESAGEPQKGKIAVGNVILNRVKSSEFPSTVYGVIFDKKYGVQFQPVMNGTVYNTPSQDSIAAAKAALKGEKPVGECLYFLNPKTAENKWIINNRTYHSTIKNHDFYM